MFNWESCASDEIISLHKETPGMTCALPILRTDLQIYYLNRYWKPGDLVAHYSAFQNWQWLVRDYKKARHKGKFLKKIAKMLREDAKRGW